MVDVLPIFLQMPESKYGDVMTVAWDYKPTAWPDLAPDNKAWEQAKQELPHGSMSEIAQRAQEIKGGL